MEVLVNYFVLRFLIGVVALILVTQTSFAQIKNRLELGVGGMKSAQYIDFLVRVSNGLTIGEETGEDDLFIIVKVNADAALDDKILSYLDFSFEVAPAYDVFDNEQSRIYLGYNALSYKQQKNIDIDQANQYLLSVIGFRVGGHHEFDQSKIRLFGQLSVDLLGVVFDSQRSSDGVALSGKEYGQRRANGVNAFIGLDIKEKVRIVLGADLMYTNALGYQAWTGEVCGTYTDEWGDSYYSCSDTLETHFDEKWFSSKLHAEVTVSLNKALSIFGRASYNVFKMTDRTEYFPSTENSQWQFMLGAKYKIFTSNQ